MALRWGIVSAGKISHDFVTALMVLSDEEHTVKAIAARNQENADKFAKDHNIPKAYEGYEKLAADCEIDVVYIGNLNPQHFEVSKLMIEHGKHVLCEKPMTMNGKQTSQLIKLAREKKVFLMEAIWSRCFPAYKEIMNVIKSGHIGDIIYVNVAFGFDLNNVERLKKKELGGGTILDLGVYTLQFQQQFYRGLKTVKMVCNGHLNSEGTDDTASAIITYPNGKIAIVSTTSSVKLPNEGLIVGTKGTIKVPNFWCPTQFILNDHVHNFELPESRAEFYHINSVGLSYEADEVRKCIIAGRNESPLVPHEDSIELARLMDAMRRDIGVVFPWDE